MGNYSSFGIKDNDNSDRFVSLPKEELKDFASIMEKIQNDSEN